MPPPRCEQCDGRTYLSRREPHPTMEPHREIHIFRCASCERLLERDVDLDGEASPASEQDQR